MSNTIKILCLVFCQSLALLKAQEVQLINATSVAEISLSIDGRLLYPKFPAGLYTAGSASDSAKVSYKIQDPSSGKTCTLTANFSPHSHQALLFYGDFSPVTGSPSKRNSSVPNIKLWPLDYALAKNESRLRYRVVNLLPGQTLWLESDGELIEIPFEQKFSLNEQKPVVTLTVKIGGETIPVLIRQRRILRNCDIIFYPDYNGKTSFIRFFEPNPDTNDETGESATEE